ncbi:hypothetical protein [Solidesulfovibrio sp.]|uniref:hypothetical protein n=1 Tax=Solidesulfovibrio sp. TaxID=2910990 RepID=UPI0026154796|nr:hypothetical protein [Solidesulfovibrio sp.]
MMPLSRFEELLGCYGADPARWPEDVRGAAQALLAASAAARAALEAERGLDAAIRAAGAVEAEALRPAGGREAALSRLRAGVAARVAAAPPQTTLPRRLVELLLLSASGGWALPFRTRLAGLATAGCCAVMAGLLLGALTTTSPAPDALLTLLEPTPPSLLAE